MTKKIMLQVARKGSPSWYADVEVSYHKTIIGAIIRGLRFVPFRSSVVIIYGMKSIGLR